MPEDKPLALPGSSWDTVKKIIRAFYAAQNEETPKLATIARYAAVARPVVSMNNRFLRSVGIVRGDQWKLTDIGLRYATGLQMNNDSMASDSLSAAIRENPILNELIRLLVARGEMKTDTFKAELMLRLNISPRDRQALFVKPVFDMLQEAGLIAMDSDTVTLANVRSLGNREFYDSPLPPPSGKAGGPPGPSDDEGLPLLLGPNRIVYVRLPDDWDGKKDLPKLLKLLEISLGDV
ncbi:MAG: hypothetical protein DMG28_16380 [Acidobacteria bacterium]|nr:MAG: hypothetical protein DMG28_16380 [Acidobacteriota bacterium]